MKYFLLLLIIGSQNLAAQTGKSNRQLVHRLQKHITYLADDRLEGRRTGSNGEKLAFEYISRHFRKSGLKPFNQNYLQPFPVADGRMIDPGSYLLVNGRSQTLLADYFPLSATGNGLLPESTLDTTDLFDIGPSMLENIHNPHFDLKDLLHTRINLSIQTHRPVLFITNSSALTDGLGFDEKDKTLPREIPIIYIRPLLAAEMRKAGATQAFNIKIFTKQRQGHNVVGWVDNKAANTVVLGAHYDHLGYGEDHNSLYTGSEKMIHNGADDNASGTAGLLELARIVKRSGPKNHNYIFVAFSGEELGLFGSKYFIEHSPMETGHISYMINMDMIGRLNDSTQGISIGGYGTSPAWGDLFNHLPTELKIKFDSSGSGPSDHTSFYRKDIPVLFFFTGTHKDYHKPSDDADKINYAGEARVIRFIYRILERMDQAEKIPFNKTREVATGKSSFKVSMGIMPDYTFAGSGVLVDGVSDNRPAVKAGIKAGDVIYQLGAHRVSDIETYMQALNRFNKGESTQVKLKRGNEDLTFNITF